MSYIALNAVYSPSSRVIVARPAGTDFEAATLPLAATETEMGHNNPADRQIIFAFVPAVNRLNGVKTLDQAVAEEVKRVADQPDVEPSFDVMAQNDASDEDGNSSETLNLGDAVIAAHETRIGLLRQRIEVLRSQGGSSHTLSDLRDRLNRAEAARLLAVARATGRAPVVADCNAASPVVRCRPRLHTLVYRDHPVRRVVGEHRPTGAPRNVNVIWAAGLATPVRHSISARYEPAVRAAHREPMRRDMNHGYLKLKNVLLARSLTRLAYRSPFSGSVQFSRLSNHRTGPHNGLSQFAAHRLANARRSLATARRLLEPEIDRKPPVAIPPTSRVAGLWEWEGSNSWSLAQYRTRGT